jgi:hypothetical protein
MNDIQVVKCALLWGLDNSLIAAFFNSEGALFAALCTFLPQRLIFCGCNPFTT